MSEDIKFERYNTDCTRVLRGTAVIGLLLRLTNDRWTAVDSEEKKLTKKTWGTLAAAKKEAPTIYAASE